MNTFPFGQAANSPRLTAAEITSFVLWVTADSVVSEMAAENKAHKPALDWDEFLLSGLDCEVYDSADTNELIEAILNHGTTLPELLNNYCQSWSGKFSLDEASYQRYLASKTDKTTVKQRPADVIITSNTDGSYMIRIEDAERMTEIRLTPEQFARAITGKLGKGTIVS